MPRATHNPDLTEQFDLDSLEGGFVTLRKMTYGERIKVREMSMKLSMQATTTAGMQQDLDIEMTQLRVDEFEFAKSIVDHNLEDEEGKKLNFQKPGVIGTLDPAIGTEIGVLIARFNIPETDPKVS